jgi:hypothetical protein
MKNSLQEKLANISKAKQTVSTGTPAPKPVIQEAKMRKRIGRPTFKAEGTEYARIFADIPETLKDRMSVALVQKFKGKYSTMSELINAAIDDFLTKNGG